MWPEEEEARPTPATRLRAHFADQLCRLFRPFFVEEVLSIFFGIGLTMK